MRWVADGGGVRAPGSRPAQGSVLAFAFVLMVTVLLPPVGATPSHASPSAPDVVPAATAALTVTQFVASPSNFVISNPTWFNVTVSGGVPPYSYYYTGLPSGCLTMNVSALQCIPKEVHAFTTTVTVNDSNGSQVSASTSITVTSGYKGPPVIESIVITPSPVAIGQVANIEVSAVSVSNSTLAYFYFNLPPGCYTFNQTPLQCIPNAPGNYYIGVQVTDAFGQPVQKHTYFNVTGSASKSTSSGGLPSYVIYVVPAVVVLLAIIVGILLFGRRRRRGPPTPFVEPPKP